MQAVARTLLHIPVFGWFLKDAIYGLPDAKYWFMANLAFTFAALVYLFGYPFLIIYGLTATAAMLTFLVYFTAVDLVTSMKARPSVGGGVSSRRPAPRHGRGAAGKGR